MLTNQHLVSLIHSCICLCFKNCVLFPSLPETPCVSITMIGKFCRAEIHVFLKSQITPVNQIMNEHFHLRQ